MYGSTRGFVPNGSSHGCFVREHARLVCAAAHALYGDLPLCVSNGTARSGLFRAGWFRTGPYGTVRDRTGPYGTVRNRTEPYGTAPGGLQRAGQNAGTVSHRILPYLTVSYRTSSYLTGCGCAGPRAPGGRPACSARMRRAASMPPQRGMLMSSSTCGAAAAAHRLNILPGLVGGILPPRSTAGKMPAVVQLHSVDIAKIESAPAASKHKPNRRPQSEQ